MGKDRLVRIIEDAFANITLGNGIGLWEAQAIDDYESKQVQEKCRENDEKNSWKNLRAEALQRCRSSLSFFDADGMRFHLPAFIIESLNNEADDPIFHLIHLDDYAKLKLTSFNEAQQQAVIHYLNGCLDQNEYEFERPVIKRALKEYWKKRSNHFFNK